MSLCNYDLLMYAQINDQPDCMRCDDRAVQDYSKAINLWGGGRSDDINPFVLTFRGNALCRLKQYREAVADYEAASNIFNSIRDIARYSDARANMALALYELGDRSSALKAVQDVLRKNPGSVDMHAALAADSWAQGNYMEALNQWRFACDNIDTGCKAYQDMNWVRTIRRW